MQIWKRDIAVPCFVDLLPLAYYFLVLCIMKVAKKLQLKACVWKEKPKRLLINCCMCMCHFKWWQLINFQIYQWLSTLNDNFLRFFIKLLKRFQTVKYIINILLFPQTFPAFLSRFSEHIGCNDRGPSLRLGRVLSIICPRAPFKPASLNGALLTKYRLK